jgi:hypothetical protein
MTQKPEPTPNPLEILELQKQVEAARAEGVAAKARGDTAAAFKAAEKETALEAKIRQIVERQVSPYRDTE